MRIGAKLAVLLLALAAEPGCDYAERFKSCRDVTVHIVNSEQTTYAVNIAGPGEDFTAETLLASGASRTIVLCVDKGDTEKFQAARDGQVLGIVRCAVDRTSYEGTSVSVVWTLQGFLCVGW